LLTGFRGDLEDFRATFLVLLTVGDLVATFRVRRTTRRLGEDLATFLEADVLRAGIFYKELFFFKFYSTEINEIKVEVHNPSNIL
jgi:hypothetical protein